MYYLAAASDVGVMQDAVVALAGAFMAALVCARLKIPLILGFLVAGVLIGPGLTGLISNQDSIALLAEIGIVFLLFTIGLKFTIRDLMSMKLIVFGAGLLQFVITGALAGGIAMLLAPPTGIDPVHIFLIACLIPHSSTAIIMKSLEQRGDAQSGPARMAVGVSLFQDISSVIWIVVIKQLSLEGDGEGAAGVVLSIATSFAVVGVLFFAARLILPWVLRLVIGTRSSEVFSLATILVVIGTAYLCGLAGASLALGAFVAGIVITEADTTNLIMGEVRGIRDTLSSMFFVSIGLMLDTTVLIDNWLLILLFAAGVMVLKFIVMAAIGLVLGFGTRVSVTSAVWLAQVGEFSFVIGFAAYGVGLIDDSQYPVFIAVVVATMASAPLLVPAGPWLAAKLERSHFLKSLRHNRIDAGLSSIPLEGQVLSNHVIVIGYGINGRNVARMLQATGVEHVIIELNPHTVREVRKLGHRIFYGDASRAEVLRHAGVERARAIVVALPDAASTGAVVAQARRLNSSAAVIARVRLVRDVSQTVRLGATAVVPEELETSLELAGRALEAVGASAWGIAQQKSKVRRDQYRAMSDEANGELAYRSHSIRDLLPLEVLAGADVSHVMVSEASKVTGQTLAQIHLRQRTGATVIAAMRGAEMVRNPGADFVPKPGDVLFIFGTTEEVESASQLFGSAP